MKKGLLLMLAVLCFSMAVYAQAPFKKGYYATEDLGVPHILRIVNGDIHIMAGSETNIYKSDGGNKYTLAGYYINDPANIQPPKSKNPPYLEKISDTSYRYRVLDQQKLYKLDQVKTEELKILFED